MTIRRPEPQGRFDLIPPVAERRLALLFQRDANLYGQRDWESGINLSRFLHDARDALNNLTSGDVSEDWPARCAWAMFALMETQARIQAGRLAQELSDLPVATLTQPPQVLPALAPPPPPPPSYPALPPVPPGPTSGPTPGK